jgi:hypothetical protein
MNFHILLRECKHIHIEDVLYYLLMPITWISHAQAGELLGYIEIYS